jgi:uncharacterized phage-like protein YoqJ
MIYGFTGHRPHKLGGYGNEAHQKLYNFAHQVVRVYLDPEYAYSKGQNNMAIVGMAQGWDMAVAQACYSLKVPYTAAIPFPGQEYVWPDPEVRSLYTTLVENAQRTVYIHNERVSYARMGRMYEIFQLRNQWIVDHSDKMIALYDGDIDSTGPRIRGGTANCLRYAIRRNKEIINVWKDWEKFNA